MQVPVQVQVQVHLHFIGAHLIWETIMMTVFFVENEMCTEFLEVTHRGIDTGATGIQHMCTVEMHACNIWWSGMV